MITFQVRLLKSSNYLMTFTENSLKKALKRMWKVESEKHEDVALYALHNGEYLKITDTQIYKERGVYEIKNYTACILEGA